MGKMDPKRPRLVKIVLPATSHWRTALANARLLRSAGFPQVYIRKSMTLGERQRDFELRQIARDRNKGSTVKQWVVYRDQLMRVTDLPSKSSGPVILHESSAMMAYRGETKPQTRLAALQDIQGFAAYREPRRKINEFPSISSPSALNIFQCVTMR
ncbi:hypothetical protein OSTOST_00625 [Ostertagia ostertagi]